VLVAQGRVFVEQVPAPAVEPGTLLVRVDHSCISAGTELAGLGASGVPLWRRALAEPAKAARVLEAAVRDGVSETFAAMEARRRAGTPTGYSAAGVVLDAGAGVEDIRPGDRVACAGAQCAHHADVIRVPRNLAVPVPDGVALAEASTVTLGAIALQGVRRAQPTLGETFVVLGLGVLGQLAVQILAASGARVIGADIDASRVRLASDLGMREAIDPAGPDDVEQVYRLTAGVGADGVVVCAATPEHHVVSTAFRMCRRKGRVVLVGDVGLHLERADFYPKEIDFLVSTSYGPGRYDPAYEERGQDYPIAYVRWTENRNMGEYLRLVAEGRVRVAPLIGAVYPVEQADVAYAALGRNEKRPLTVLLAYGATGEDVRSRTAPNPAARPARPGQVRLALVGAGSFAKGVHLPNLAAMRDLFHLRAVVSRTGHNAQAAARQFGARYASTDYAAVLADPEVDAVLVATRHDRHAGMVLEALAAGKHVLVEKPLALTRAEVAAIAAFYDGADTDPGRPLLLTGFNRRFSRYGVRLAEAVRRRNGPMLLTYRMNAGFLPADHWTHGPEGGGRNLGEACHVYDLFTALTGARVRDVTASGLGSAGPRETWRDTFVSTATFEDGSVATLAYTALGAEAHPKEQLEVFVDGTVWVLDDYRRLGRAGGGDAITTKSPDKGQREALAAFGRAVREGGNWPIPLWQQIQATEIALAVEEALVS
jgi:predicted dehydrogenase/threonine dehydrogenase-like Zn-dependent dehydrogenase